LNLSGATTIFIDPDYSDVVFWPMPSRCFNSSGSANRCVPVIRLVKVELDDLIPPDGDAVRGVNPDSDRVAIGLHNGDPNIFAQPKPLPNLAA
jgi:hypothetical protein